MNNFVKIHFKGKDYVGQVKRIDRVCREARLASGQRILDFGCYIVTIIEKDTNCQISDIEVASLFDIKPYEVENE